MTMQGDNGKISYQLVHGDRQNQFKVNRKTGTISVAKNLDREMISSYGE